MKFCVTFLTIVLLQFVSVLSWGSQNKDKVLLEKVTAVTLTEGKMTNGRRSSPVPQLDCVGGSAGCGHKPRVVQCKNVGFDGYDVQWECTADLDNEVRFAQIEVSCEGYDYPDDPYVLKGSCGLRYQLDWTSDNHRQHRGDYHGNSYSGGNTSSNGGSSWVGSIIQLVVIGVVIYCVLGACFRGGRGQHAGYTTPSGSSYNSGHGYNSGPGYSSGGSSSPGFWSGAATGGMLGYMFGNRGSGRRHYNSGYGSGYGSGFSSGWGSGGSSSSSRSSSSSSRSRSSSGFGGTSRR